MRQRRDRKARGKKRKRENGHLWVIGGYDVAYVLELDFALFIFIFLSLQTIMLVLRLEGQYEGRKDPLTPLRESQRDVKRRKTSSRHEFEGMLR